MADLAVLGAIGIVIGLVLGLTGAGGSILAVPLLMAGMGWSLVSAAPVALIAVFASASVGAWSAWRRDIVRYRAALLMGEVSMSDALAMQALDACDRNADDAEVQVLAAKAKAARVALLAGQEAVQMHGGIGMTDEFDIGFFLKRAAPAVKRWATPTTARTVSLLCAITEREIL